MSLAWQPLRSCVTIIVGGRLKGTTTVEVEARVHVLLGNHGFFTKLIN